jgi:hypothetical protein
MSQKIYSNLDIKGNATIGDIANATSDTDKFLVSDAGVVKYRTGSEMLSDLGVAPGVASNIQHQVKAGVAINKGQAVYVTGADGTNMIVGLASNASEATSSKTMGLMTSTVAANGFGNVVAEGLLAGLDTSTANAGDPVWLGTNGSLIYGLANKPYAPAHLVFIGIVTRVNNNNGEIFVKVQNGFELNEIHDVDLKTTTPSGNEILAFEGAPVNLWRNKTIPSVLGYTPVSQARTLTINGTTFDLSADRSWTIASGVTSFNTRTGAITLTSGDVTGALGYTPYNSSNPAGYISSYTETDPTVPAHVKSITTTEKLNWNTAFSWGNHASAGYVPSARTITINGTTQDLSANRSWTVSGTDNTKLPLTGGTLSGALFMTSSYPYIQFNDTVSTTKSAYIQYGVTLGGGGAGGGGYLLNYSQDRPFGWTVGGNQGVMTIDTVGNVQALTSLRAPIFYDSNDTTYYIDPASNGTRAAFLNGNVWIRPKSESYGEGIAFLMPSQSTWGGLRWVRSTTDFTGAWAFGYFGNEANNDIGFHNGTNGWRLDQSFNMTSIGSVRSPIFYDSNNTGYYVDPASTSNTNTMLAYQYQGNGNVGGTGAASWHPSGIYCGSTMWQYGAMYKNYTDIWDVNNVYARGWFRNYGNQGIYNQDYGVHFYAQSSSAWTITGSGGNIELQFRSNHNSTLRGYVYADTSNNIGFLTSGGGWRLRCDDSGNAIATGDVTAYSDRRVKENIITIEKPLDKVLSLRGVYYNRIDSDDKQRKVGVIAQETLEVLPEVVGQDTDGMYNVAYGNITAVLIEAIKEQQTQIEELKKLVNELKK